MAIRHDPERIEQSLAVNNFKTRAEVRKFLLDEWAKESVGRPYRYFVEVLDNGKKIYLDRPGRVNKGCDFIIFIEDQFLYKNGNDKAPSHQELLRDLRNKKEHLDSKIWQHLMTAIESVHAMTSCEFPHDSKRAIDNLGPMSFEQIQLLCKWFFIEQDLTYWSGKGRDMLFNAIRAI